MKTALIITLGTRDISLSPDDLNHFFEEETIKSFSTPRGFLLARLFGQALLNKKLSNELKKKIQLPIVKAGIEFVLGQTGVPTTIILVATNQKTEVVGDRFWQNDTYPFAQVLQQVIPFQFKKFGTFDIRIEKVSDNVAYLDSMYDYFNAALNKKIWKPLADYDELFLLNQGGIDAINTALMLNCLNKYGEKITLLSVNEHLGLCAKLDFAEQYLMDKERLRAISAIKKYRYAFIKNLAVPPIVKSLAAFGEHKLNFDFDEAEKVLLGDFPRKQRTYRDQLIQTIHVLRNSEDGLLKELYENAKIKFEQEAYVDFLLRLFRILEGISKQKVMSYLSFPFNHLKWEKDLNRFLNQAPNVDLKNHLDNYVLPDGRKLIFTNATIPLLLAILAFFDPVAYTDLSKLQGLSQLRNKSIGAHDFDPVSKKQIEKDLNAQGITISDMFTTLDKYLGKPNFYLNLNQQLEKYLIMSS